MVDHPPASSDRRLAFLRSSYPYLRLEELPSSSEIHLDRALVVDGPLDGRLPLPGETMPVVLSSVGIELDRRALGLRSSLFALRSSLFALRSSRALTLSLALRASFARRHNSGRLSERKRC